MSAILKQKLIDIANGFTKYGLWKGGGSSALSEMKDVTLSNLQSNDVLTYNGSFWVNDDNLQKQINTLNSNLVSGLNTKVNKSTYALVNIKSITFDYDSNANKINIQLWINDYTVFLIVFTSTELQYFVSNDSGQNWHNYWIK